MKLIKTDDGKVINMDNIIMIDVMTREDAIKKYDKIGVMSGFSDEYGEPGIIIAKDVTGEIIKISAEEMEDACSIFWEIEKWLMIHDSRLAIYHSPKFWFDEEMTKKQTSIIESEWNTRYVDI